MGWSGNTKCLLIWNLALDLHKSGEVGAARKLNEDTLTRSRRVLGDDHPDTQLIAERLAKPD